MLQLKLLERFRKRIEKAMKTVLLEVIPVVTMKIICLDLVQTLIQKIMCPKILSSYGKRNYKRLKKIRQEFEFFTVCVPQLWVASVFQSSITSPICSLHIVNTTLKKFESMS